MSRVPDDQELPRDPARAQPVTRAIVVTAAVVCRDGCYLVTRRQQGVHLEGFWEFPGGKCDAGEPLAACLARELREELDVEARIGDEIHVVTHGYDDRDIELHFFECELARDPQPQLGQDMRWVPRADLQTLEFPPADAELIRLLARSVFEK
jgi:8-oxo-dGTP diphosphatase